MFRFFRGLTELLGWIQIFLSPVIVCGSMAAVIYFSSPDPGVYKVLGSISLLLLGILLGILWAERIRRTRGTVSFLASLLRTPELERKRSDGEDNRPA